MAQLTPGGTVIENKATATFITTDGTSQTTESNTVTTTVNTVYNLNIENDNTNPPSGGSATSSDFSNSIDSNNDLNASAGDQVVIPYTIENNTNNPIDVTLAVTQDNTDDYDLQNVQIYIDVNGDGLLDAGDTLVTGPITLPATDGTAGSGTDFENLLVVGTVPAGQDGSDVALIDLVATNDTAVGDGATLDAIADENQTYENNNLARITVYENAQIGLAKNLDSVVNNGDGTYDLTFTFTVENLGNALLDNVQITDDIDGQLATPGVLIDPVGITGVGTTGGLTADISPLDGTDDTLLTGNDSLAAGASGTLTFTIRIDASGAALPIDLANSATADAADQSGGTVTDTSDDGLEPDEDGDGFANEDPDDGQTDDGDNGTPTDPSDDEGDGTTTNENDPTTISLTENGVLGVAKNVPPTTHISDNGDGSYNVTVDIYIENLGDVVIDDIQVTEDLVAIFGLTSSIDDIPTTPTSTSTPSLPGNPNFNGDTDTNLLDPATTATARSLQPGETALVSFVMRITPDLGAGPYNNQVTATGTTPTGDPVNDLSHEGSDPDPDGNEDPSDNNSPTPIPFTEIPVIGAAKDLVGTEATDNNDGTFTASYQIIVQNMGNVALNNVQVTENLVETFPTPATFTVDDKRSLTDGTGGQNTTLNVSATFDGNANTNLLEAGQTLGVGQTAAFQITVTFDPNDSTGPFNNTAVATGTSPDGIPIDDDSQDGLDPDIDNDGPSDDGDPTPTPLPTSPAIGAAKQLVVVDDSSEPIYTVTYDIRVENIGNVTLNGVQAVEDLSAAFGSFYQSAAVTDVSPVGSATDTASLNGSFDGSTNTNLLDGTDSLEPNEFYIIRIVATIDLTNTTTYGPFNNTVTVTATDPGGTSVTDDSDDGVDPDPNNNDDAGDPDENDPTPVTFIAPSDLDVQKWQAPVTVTTSGAAPTNAEVAAACTAGTYVQSAVSINPSDPINNTYSFICYRITAQNTGTAGITDVFLQDVVPDEVRTGGLSGGLVGSTLDSTHYDSTATINADGSITGGVDLADETLECSQNGFVGTVACPTSAIADSSITDIRSGIASMAASEVLTLDFAVWVP